MIINRILGQTSVVVETTPLAPGSFGGADIGFTGNALFIPFAAAGASNGLAEQAYGFAYNPATAGDNAKAFTITNSPAGGTFYVDGVAAKDADGNPVRFTKIMGIQLKFRRLTPNPGVATTGTITLTSANWPGLPASLAIDCSADFAFLTDFYKAITTSATLTLTASGSNCGLTVELVIIVAP